MLSSTQQFSGIVILSIAQNVFLNQLAHNLTTQVPGLDPNKVLSSGVLASLMRSRKISESSPGRL